MGTVSSASNHDLLQNMELPVSHDNMRHTRTTADATHNIGLCVAVWDQPEHFLFVSLHPFTNNNSMYHNNNNNNGERDNSSPGSFSPSSSHFRPGMKISLE